MVVSLKPLSIGDVISLSLQLWRTQLHAYWKIGLVASLFSLFNTLGILVFYVTFTAASLALLPAETRDQILETVSVTPILALLTQIPLQTLGLLSLTLIPLMCFATAHFVALGALISRLAFNKLTERVESPKQARMLLQSKLWSFLGITLLVSAMLIGLYLGLSIIGTIILFIYTVITGSILALFENSTAGLMIGILAGIGGVVLLILIFLFPITWFYSRWILSELPIAIEPNLTVFQSIDRSWELTKGSVNRLMFILFILSIVSLPILLLFTLVPEIIFGQLLNTTERDSSLFVILTIVSFSTSQILSVGAGTLLLPLWQIAKAVIYYDLRNRREGLGLNFKL